MLTSVVGSMKTDEVLKEALDYSSDCLHNYNNCSSNFLLQRYYDDGINTNLFNEPLEFYNEIGQLFGLFPRFVRRCGVCPYKLEKNLRFFLESEENRRNFALRNR